MSASVKMEGLRTHDMEVRGGRVPCEACEYSLGVLAGSVPSECAMETQHREQALGNPAFQFCKVEFRDVLSPASSELKFKSLRTAFLCLSLSELGSEPKPPVMAAI